MRINSLILFITILSFTYISIFEAKRILHIGVDGVLQKCINKASHVMFDLFKSSGSYTFKARTAIETMSGPGWSNILCGVDSEWSGIKDNEWIAPWIYQTQPDITPVSGTDKTLRCIMEHLKKNLSNSTKTSKIGFLSDWDFFENFSDKSIPGSIDNFYYCDGKGTAEGYNACDEQIVSKASKIILDKDFDYLFVYFGSVDETGHIYGFCDEKYVERLTAIDSLMYKLYAKLFEAGVLNDTVLVWTTDHGSDYLSHDHGIQNDDNLIVPWFVMGPGIKKNYEIKKLVKNLDTPATISKILGVTPFDQWMSRSVDEIFESNENDIIDKKSDIIEVTESDISKLGELIENEIRMRKNFLK